MFINTQSALNDFCARARGQKYVTIDTEFLREKTYYPKLCLIQIGLPEGGAAAIDTLAGLDMAPIWDLFFDPGILKVIHSGRQDLEIIYNITGQVVHPLFDTQIAAMVCGYGESAGYEALVRDITGQGLDKTAQFTNWAQRPLSDRQLTYALADVIHLQAVYLHLREKLAKLGRIEWVEAEDAILTNPATYQVDVDQLWRRIKMRTARPKNLVVLKFLSAWRERRAQEKDLPRNWVLRDETLADLAGQMPRNAEQLKKIRGISTDLAEGAIGKMILREIEAALACDPATWPRLPERKAMPPQAAAIAEVLRMLLRVECHALGVAAKIVASAEDIDALALNDEADIPALSGWRYEVFGREALALKHGQIAIGIKDGKIEKIAVGA
ncbi:MAG: ribonuclease D [Alphaproteobacteria bacterium]|nr:ribonuclease D [Alphaproteobacteria bacterium]